MKFDCGETTDERYNRLQQWHKFYPWFPRRVGSHDCRAFEWIERRLVFTYIDSYWEYRAIEES